MKRKEIAKLALKKEAHQKPNGQLIIGDRVIPYNELERLLDEGDKWIEENLLKPFERLLKESKRFLEEVMDFALSDSGS